MIMQIHQLTYLVAVADERSVTRAAARLRVAQPGVSAQIRKLERELGHELLDRTGARIGLTDVGAEVVAAARTALDAVDGVRRVVDELAGLVRGRVAVGMVTSTPVLDLPELLADFHDAHPDVEATLAQAPSGQLAEHVRAGRLDLALVGLADDAPDDLHVETVTDEPLVAAVRPDDPLADAGPADVGRLADRVFVAPARGTALREALDQAFAAAGRSPRIAFEANDPAVVARMVHRGLGISLLPASLRAFRDGELRAVALTGAAPRARLVLIWRRGGPRSPAARELTRRLLGALQVASSADDTPT